MKNSLHPLHPLHPGSAEPGSTEGVDGVRGVRCISHKEDEALRLLAKFLVRAYLADHKLKAQNGLDCPSGNEAPLGPMTGDDES